MASCIHKKICSGCPWIELSQDIQRERKIQALSENLLRTGITIPQPIDYQLPGDRGLRDRVDLTYADGKYGFYHRDSRDIFAVEECPQMSPDLFALFEEIRKISIPIKKGSIRLRISPNGNQERGLWLDFANEDIRFLFEEKETLHRLMELGHVEIGQRRKALTWSEKENRFRLGDPVYRKWIRSWQNQKPVELYSLIGSFSQTGDLANRTLIEIIEKFLTNTAAQSWVEFGAGSGNLTIPLAGENRRVQAVEFDEDALTGLQKTLEENPSLQKRISLFAGDYQRKEVFSFEGLDGILTNPPRSGLGNFLEPLKTVRQKPKDFIYMSCFLDSFSRDALQMQDLGYCLQELTIVDQFPQTPHFEILSRWTLKPTTD